LYAPATTNPSKRARWDSCEIASQRDGGREEELREGGAHPWLLRRRLRPAAAAGRWSVETRVCVDAWRRPYIEELAA
jgi:hypothetical protein